jgi:phage terminase large subunit-like protein
LTTKKKLKGAGPWKIYNHYGAAKTRLKAIEYMNRDYENIANQYCLDVLDGKIPVCRYVKLACKRHLNDLKKSKNDPSYPYEFNPILIDRDGNEYKPVDRRCGFAEQLPHIKGKWMGQKITLEPEQIFVEGAIFGWIKKKNNKRRFSIVYDERPRKTGKSTRLATTGLYMLTSDREPGAEIYSGATSLKQALEVFRPAWMMVKNSPELCERFGLSLSGNPKNPTSIYRLEDMSRFEPVIGKPGDGSSPHCAIIDEYHEHRTSEQFDTMSTGMGSREQPLLYVITTAGTDTSAPCYDMHLKAIKILEGTIEDDSFFAIIYTIDQDMDWKDFEVWKMANPGYGVSIEPDYLERKYKEAMTDVSKQNINLCKHLDAWQNAGVAWMNMVKWEACKDESSKLEDFKGKPCYAAFDLASKIDISSLVLVFEHNGGYAAFAKHYLPEETVTLAGNDHYVKWVKEGYITQTPGARTDFKYIEDDLKAINADHPICELAYDPRESTYLVNNVMEWLGPEKCIEITQGPALMSEPMKEVEALIYDCKLWHSGDPVLTWMIGNIVKRQGRNTGPVKYYYPTKERNENKIDGGVCIIMGIGRAILHHEESAYEGMSKEEILAGMAF